MKYLLDDNAVAAFARDGFLAVDQLVDADEVSRLRTLLLALHATNAGFAEGAQFDAVAPDGRALDEPAPDGRALDEPAPDGRALDEPAPDGRALDGAGNPPPLAARRFPQILNARIFDRRLAHGPFPEVAAAIARQLLGPKARFRNDISFLKPAHIGSDTPWHQDEAFGDPAVEHQQVTLWLALTPATEAASCLAFIPGSHRAPVLAHQPMGGDPRVHALECIGPFDRAAAVPCPLQSGGCTIHTQRTLHYAGPNTTDQFRLAYALLFDLPPRLRAAPMAFPWQQGQHTDRAARQRAWRRRGGLMLHLWRHRHRVSVRRGLLELRKRYRGWRAPHHTGQPD